jgi:hypothetical protein
MLVFTVSPGVFFLSFFLFFLALVSLVQGAQRRDLFRSAGSCLIFRNFYPFRSKALTPGVCFAVDDKAKEADLSVYASQGSEQVWTATRLLISGYELILDYL